MDETYWANKNGKDLADAMIERTTQYAQALRELDLYELWERAERMMRGLDPEGSAQSTSRVRFGGSQGELVLSSTNHYASILRGLHALITGTRPAVNVRAANGSSEAAEAAMLFSGICEYDMAHKKLEDALVRTAWFALQYGEGVLFQAWDTTLGREVGADPETGRVFFEGDIRTVPLRPMDVIRDPQAPIEGDDDLEWAIYRRKVNRWNLLERFAKPKRRVVDGEDGAPRFEDGAEDGYTKDLRRHILSLPAPARELESLGQSWRYASASGTAFGNDYCYIYELYQEPTPACPEGKWAIQAGDRILASGPMPFARLPGHSMMPDILEGVPFGHSVGFDLMSPQERYDALISAADTNLDAGAVNNIWTRSGDSLDAEKLSGGLRHLQSAEIPQVLNMGRVGEDVYRMAGLHKKNMEELSGYNSVARGNPDDNLKSGAALALVQSMAVQFNSSTQRAYGRLVESVVNARLDLYKRFASSERMTEIAGPDHAGAAVQWSSEDLQLVNGVIVELANPLSQTSAGRQELADKFVEMGLIQTAEQYSMVVSTGRAEPLYKRDRNEIRLIGSENDELRKAARDPQVVAAVNAAQGDTRAIMQIAQNIVPVFFAQRHLLHIREHSAELNSPATYENTVFAHLLAAVVQKHIELREQLVREKPWLCEALGEPPTELEMQMVQMEAQVMAAQQTGQAPGAGPMPAGEPMPAPQAPQGPPPNDDQAARAQVPAVTQNPAGGPDARMPLMPVNPMTGERVTPGGQR